MIRELRPPGHPAVVRPAAALHGECDTAAREARSEVPNQEGSLPPPGSYLACAQLHQHAATGLCVTVTAHSQPCRPPPGLPPSLVSCTPCIASWRAARSQSRREKINQMAGSMPAL